MAVSWHTMLGVRNVHARICLKRVSTLAPEWRQKRLVDLAPEPVALARYDWLQCAVSGLYQGFKQQQAPPALLAQ